MKNTFRLIPAVLAAIAVLAGCVQEITSPSFEKDKVNPAAEGSRIIAVSFSQQTKTYLDKDGLQPKFEDGKDTVLISNTNALDTCVVSVKDNKATISTNLTGPLTAVYPYTAAKMNEGNQNEIDTVLVSAVQSGKFADANICMAKMTSENDGSLSFENKTAVFKIIPGAGADTKYVEVSAKNFDIANDGSAGSTRTIHVATTTADSVYVSILVPEGLTVGSLSFSDGTNEKTVTGDKASTKIEAGSLYTVTNENWKSPEADTPDGAIKGVFTVGAGPDGKAGTADDIKVHFSQGNLYAKKDNNGMWNWDFYAKQYQYNSLSTSNSRMARNTDTEIDLFTWGYDNTSSNDSYSFNPVNTKGITAHTTTEDKQLVYNTDSGDDWGVAYCSSNNITVGTWRTLTTEEWQYLFTGTTNARYAKATVDTIAGIILLPDTYTHPSGVAVLTNINTNNAAFTVNTYDVTAWEAMESAGAVFLPAAGCRDGSNVDDVGDYGFYWSSTAFDGNCAYFVYFDSSDVDPINDGRLFGNSVRLVTDVSAAPTPTEPTSEYVEIAADYDNNPNTANTTLKWYRQNLAITDSGNKKWKGGQTEAVKVPGTDKDVIVGDYFQWAASYGGYNVTENQKLDSLLVYTEFTNTGCGDTEDEFTFIGDKQFTQPISPHYNGSDYGKYNNTDNKKILDTTSTSNDDVAHIILGEKWRMPTSAEFQAMKDATYWYWDSDDMGYYVYAPASGDEGGLNGKKSDGETDVSGTYTKAAALLFFPAAGDGSYSSLNAGSEGSYWSSSLETDKVANAYGLCFDSEEYVNPQDGKRRFGGFSVRPVSD